ncbi:hypothetical protein E3Q22_04206 [Wallemia mellicola]|uniref:Uncharacterized protein n=1 Tax=Wallemia mellicola TaxID=1708541 RepID=A0A4T0LLK5_9BASI|nr:hypothetical protein E3Q24_04118 [Wallemia mellicola]TIB70398.1 hypothetical protein E3Q23_04203 [Wallemia mellicola]TIB74331.1 hypothetical protein E3Q22_04206 [Wallemia mellicola]TIB79361.1 hypothetical protein E3Q21_04151 [Wallemia mellicola]TIB83482.1 hypothetical protein E3Q20_04132 [Wallemia mellicola]
MYNFLLLNFDDEMVNDIIVATENLRTFISKRDSTSKFNKVYIDLVNIRDKTIEAELDKSRRCYLDKLSTELVTAFGLLPPNKANELLYKSLEQLLAALTDFIKKIYSQQKNSRNKLQKKKFENEWIIVD